MKQKKLSIRKLVILVLIIIASSVSYYIEHADDNDSQPSYGSETKTFGDSE